MNVPDLETVASGSSLEFVEMLDQAYSTLRHELVNSINSLKITLQVLAAQYEAFDQAKRAEYLERALGQVARQQAFVERLRTYSAPNPANSPVPLLVFWSDLLIPVSARLARLGIGFQQDCAAGPCVISADKNALVQVLDCLIDNAVDALDGAADPRVVLTAHKEGECVTISVNDNGPGILNEHRKKIFTPLFTTRENRRGLGLSTSQRSVAKMGGQIIVKSARGRGTTVEVRLNTLDNTP